MRDTAFSDACEGTGRGRVEEPVARGTSCDGIYRQRRRASQAPLWGGTVLDPESPGPIRRAHSSEWSEPGV